jgi:outer membrane protein
VKYWLVLILLGTSWTTVMAQDRMKIGYIDVRRVVAESAAGKRAGERLQIQVKKAEADTLKERQELERLRSDLEKKAPLLKEEERRSLESDFQKRSVNLQRTMSDLQQEIQAKEREMMQSILKDLEGVVVEVGKAEKFTLILDRSQILFADQGIDITNKVIETFNSRAKK